MDEQLLIRFLTRQCSEEELRKISEWIKLDKANADWLFEIEKIWCLKSELQFSEKEEIEDAFSKLMDALESTTLADAGEPVADEVVEMPVRRINFFESSWFKYAAAIIIVVLASVNIYYFTLEPPKTANSIEVPKGQRVVLTLSDGTKVWLNSGSRFVYPSAFSRKKREVSLEGEGYFEVVSNARKPFVVQSSALDVTVLGTKFNMKAYKNEESVVVLKEGKVEVATEGQEHKIVLRPNEQVNYSTQSGLQLRKNADVAAAESWRKGELAFIGESLSAIVKSLERHFDKQIVIKDPALEGELFTCRVQENATLEQVLNLLKDTRKLNYRVENEKVLIFKI